MSPQVDHPIERQHIANHNHPGDNSSLPAVTTQADKKNIIAEKTKMEKVDENVIEFFSTSIFIEFPSFQILVTDHAAGILLGFHLPGIVFLMVIARLCASIFCHWFNGGNPLCTSIVAQVTAILTFLLITTVITRYFSLDRVERTGIVSSIGSFFRFKLSKDR